jgi:hypothetical protein
MPKKTRDWLKGKTLPEQDLMFTNVESKIDNYKATYNLSGGWVDEVKLICQTFHSAFTGVMQSRANGKQRDTWFSQLLESVEKGMPAPAPPVFTAITIPAGAETAIYKVFREKMDFFKSNEAYSKADGDDLMITAPEGEESDLGEASPELKISENADGAVSTTYVKGEFGGLELQYREVGQAMWQLADKSSEKTIVFTPNVSTPNVPVKIELRGVYILKNQRVGKWSPTYTLTIG